MTPIYNPKIQKRAGIVPLLVTFGIIVLTGIVAACYLYINLPAEKAVSVIIGFVSVQAGSVYVILKKLEENRFSADNNNTIVKDDLSANRMKIDNTQRQLTEQLNTANKGIELTNQIHDLTNSNLAEIKHNCLMR